MNRLASLASLAVRALAALMLVALLAGGSNLGAAAEAHHAAAPAHAHLHLDGDALAQSADCCQPASSQAPCVGGCAFSCGGFAPPSPPATLLDNGEAEWRHPLLRHLAGATPDLATPPPKAFG